MKNNNKGFSLVEMMVAVAILSIVMMGIVGILASMSKSFGNSQKEVALQDSVQSTYVIVSELIKEAQTTSETDSEIEFDDTNDIAHIVVEDTYSKDNSKFYIVKLDKNNNKLYLYTDKLYDDAGTRKDYHAVGSTAICNPKNLLAINVTSFDINTDKLENDGYVILGLEVSYGSRNASVTQNVYLRNSNKSAEWVHEIEEDDEENGLEGYTLITIKSAQCDKDPFYINTSADADDFTIIGQWENAEGVRKEERIPSSMLSCDDFGKIITTSPMFIYAIHIEGYENPIGVGVTITSLPTGSGSLTTGNLNLSDPEKETISSSSSVKVFYHSGYSDNLVEATVTKTIYKCECGSEYRYLGTVDWGVIKYQFQCTNSSCSVGHQWSAQTYDSLASVPSETVSSVEMVPDGTAGQFTVRNESTSTVSNVEVFVYFEQDDAYFIPVDGSGHYLTFEGSESGSAAVTYDMTHDIGSGKIKFIKINIPTLSGYVEDAVGNKTYDQYTFNYKWECPSGIATMAVYSVETN